VTLFHSELSRLVDIGPRRADYLTGLYLYSAQEKDVGVVLHNGKFIGMNEVSPWESFLYYLLNNLTKLYALHDAKRLPNLIIIFGSAQEFDSTTHEYVLAANTVARFSRQALHSLYAWAEPWAQPRMADENWAGGLLSRTQ
jgi:hypothetical protein